MDIDDVFRLIRQERIRQEQKHGKDNRRGWGPLVWVDGILGEEFAEAKREAYLLEATGKEKFRQRLICELVQVAAVAVATIEDLEK